MTRIQEKAYLVSGNRWRSQNGVEELNIPCTIPFNCPTLIDEYKRTIQTILLQNISQEEKERQWSEADYYFAEKLVWREILKQAFDQNCKIKKKMSIDYWKFSHFIFNILMKESNLSDEQKEGIIQSIWQNISTTLSEKLENSSCEQVSLTITPDWIVWVSQYRNGWHDEVGEPLCTIAKNIETYIPLAESKDK